MVRLTFLGQHYVLTLIKRNLRAAFWKFRESESGPNKGLINYTLASQWRKRVRGRESESEETVVEPE